MFVRSIIIILFLFSCYKEPTIIGKWNLNRDKPKETMIINEDSTLIVQVQVETGEQFSLNGTWIKDQNNMNIKFDVDGIKKTVLTQINLKKDTLTITNTATGEKSTYIKEKR
tara:strand:+ start:176 stop:511 length:336 start_codon:yes stop_codon:yes gene_type:complete